MINEPSPVAIKICGITSTADALAACEAGADMLGFNFYERSRRFIAPRAAAEIIDQLRTRGSSIQCVGVFVDAEPSTIQRVAEQTKLDAVQLHGNETPEDCRATAPLRTIKALRVHSDFDPSVPSAFPCEAILLDTWNANEAGGTGEVFDWSIAAEVRRVVAQLILAGGLTAANVAEAIRQVRPNAVDVCSGVEDAPGRKSGPRMREFVNAVTHVSAAAAPAR